MNEMLDRFTGNISPVALLVSSFFWSWFDVVPCSPALFLAAGRPADALPFIVSFAASVALLAVFAASAKVRSRVLEPRVFAVGSFLCGSVGTLLVYLSMQVDPALCPALLVAGSVLVGAYMSIGAVVCGGIATCQGTTNALVHIAAALPLNIVAIILVACLRPVPSVAFAVLLPLFSALCFAMYVVRGQNRATLATIAVVRDRCAEKARCVLGIIGRNASFLLMVLFVAAAFGFVNYQAIFLTSVQSAYLEYATVALRAFVSLALLVGYLCYSWRPYLILRVALVVMSVGLVISGVAAVLGAPGTFLSDCLFLGGYAGFDLLIWTLIIMISYRSGASLLRLICIVYSVDQFGILAGTVVGRVVSGPNAVVASYMVLGSALLLLTLLFSSGKNSVRDNLSTYEIDFVRVDDAASDESGMLGTAGSGEAGGILPSSAVRIAELSSRFFLTSRETDVLALLVAGRNGPYISEHLHVSENTVKSHIRHIYTKVNVHNRQELLDLVFPPQL